MTTEEPAFYNFRTLRAHLREAIDTAKSGTPVLIGAHGHPEVAMTAVSPNGRRVEPVDAAALETLLCLVGPATVRFVETRGARPGDEPRFGIPDNFGRVLDWLWASGRRDRAVLLVADLLATIRDAEDLASQPTYETYLRTVRLSLTSDAATRDELIAYVDQRITGYYSTAKLAAE